MGGENRVFCIKVKETSGLSLPLVSFTNFLFIFVVRGSVKYDIYHYLQYNKI